MADFHASKDSSSAWAVNATGRERAASRWVTVEPVILAAMLSMTSIALIKPLYVKSRVSGWYNSTKEENYTCGEHEENAAADHVQSEASVWLLYMSLASGIPSMVSTIILCTMSDRLGRKMAMVLSLLGFTAQAAMTFVTVLFQLPLAVLLVGEFLQGLTGGFGLLFAASISYLADATSLKQRTMRIVIAETTSLLVTAVNEIVEGLLIKSYGFIPVASVALGSCVVGLIYVTVPPFLIETVDTRKFERQEFLEVWKNMKSFLQSGKRWHMLLLSCVIFISMSQITGYFSILVLYGTGEPFCWQGLMAGVVTAVGFLCVAIGTAVGTKVLSLCIGEYWLMQIGSLSMFLVFLITGLAQSTTIILVAAAIGCLRAMPAPVARSVISKITLPDEIGAAFAIVGCLESLSTFVSGLLAHGLYSATVTVMPALTFYIYAGVTIVPAGLVMAMQIVWPQKKKYTQLEGDVQTSINADTEAVS
ncbi:proton-coupled folate transporter-like [Patiria miniata]|uniref:Proton-coupled folate transporter n=1 Tax=Patiria miniata TaxID=46514 RepID=A0A914B7W2_PATMI|nr:proton-coupled folate transporter-like [Patiria miniata]